MSQLADRAIDPSLGYSGAPKMFNNGPILENSPGQYQQVRPLTFTQGVEPTYRGDSQGNTHTPLDTRNISSTLGYNGTPPSFNPF